MNRTLCVFLLFFMVISTYAELAFPPYPKSLTEKQWSKDIDIEDVEGNEDDVAREDKEMVGDYLKSIKKLHKKINMKDYDPLMEKGLKDWNVYSLAEFETAAKAKAKSEPSKMRKKIKELLKKLKAIKKKWKKNDAVSKNDKQDLLEIIEELGKFSDQIQYKGKKGLKKRLANVFQDVRNRMARRAKVAWDGLKKIVSDMSKDLKTMNRAKYDEYLTKIPIMKKAISLVFGEGSAEYIGFEKK